MQIDIDMREVALACDDANMEKKEHLKHMEEMSNMHDISQKKAVRKITIACFICTIFMILEIVAGLWSNSLSLMTDASHLFCDICSFALNLFSIYISNLQGDVDMSFGYHRAEIIGALFSIFFIWALSAYILYSSVLRLFHVKIVNGYIMFVTAFVSTLANIFTAFILKVHSHGLDFDHPKCEQGHNHSNNHSYRHNPNSMHHHAFVENNHTVSQGNDVHPHKVFSHDHVATLEIKTKLKDNSIYRKGKNAYTKLKEDTISCNNGAIEKIDTKWDTNKTGSNCEYVALDYYEDMDPNPMKEGKLNKLARNCSECEGGGTKNGETEGNRERDKEKEAKGAVEVKIEMEINQKKENRPVKEKMEGKGKEEILFEADCNEERYLEKQQWREQRIEDNARNSDNQSISTTNNMNNKKDIKGKMTKKIYKQNNVQINRNINESGTERTNESEAEAEAEMENLSRENSTVDSNKPNHACCKKKRFLSNTSHVNIYEQGSENFCFKGGNKRKVLKSSTLSFLQQDRNCIFPKKKDEISDGHNFENNEKEKNRCCKENLSCDKPNSTEVGNINLKAAYLHALSDLIQNIGVIIASLIIWFNPQYSVVDPICSILFCFIVFSTTVSVIKEVLNVLMEGTPEGLNLIELKNDLLKISGVIDIHDLHVWSLSIGKPALACHIVTHKNNAHNVLKYATSLCQNKYKILHTTVQTDYPSNVSTCETYAHLKCSNLKLIA